MKQTEEQLTPAQESAKRLANMKPHSSYKPVADLPIPARNGVLVKPLPKPSVVSIPLLKGNEDAPTSLLLSTGDNTQSTCEAVIMSVGPLCADSVRIGLRIRYSNAIEQSGATKFYHKGVEYVAMDEYSILFYIPDETTVVDNGVKTSREMDRGKRIKRNQFAEKVIYARDENAKDKEKDKTKGKIRKMK